MSKTQRVTFTTHTGIEAASTRLDWQPKQRRGPHTAKTLEKIKQDIAKLGDSHPGNRTRLQWIKELHTSSGTYDRALRELRKKLSS
jgi:hypothetical protein